jgi:hypothetical protein
MYGNMKREKKMYGGMTRSQKSSGGDTCKEDDGWWSCSL